MNEETRQALRQVIDYLADAETDHYEESTDKENHIFLEVLKLDKWLKNQDDIINRNYKLGDDEE